LGLPALSEPEQTKEQSLQVHGQRISLLRFWGPRYWLTWFFVLWLRLTAALPWRVGIRLHKSIGRAAGRLVAARRAIVRRNLEICFPQLDERALDELTNRHFESLGAFFAETAVSWFGSPERGASLFRVEGAEHLKAALAGGRGVLLFSGHFTTLEICVPFIKSMVPLYGFVFNGRRNLLLNELQRRGRIRAAHVSLVNDNVRSMLRLLAKNATVWYAADQASINGGELIPFFGVPSMTSTATSRLARVSGAAIVPLFFCRLADDSGYLLRFCSPLDNLPSGDEKADTVRLMAVLENFIRECPDQYFWTHRRFKSRRGMPDVYESSKA
jgi:Kdo2-lipid IVA lauroyltransferase/acyltransferase